MPRTCAHLEQIQDVDPSPVRQCVECVKIGAPWVHLRQCLVCGLVHCCDNSPNRHATGHYKAAGHAVMRSIEAGEAWGWCYEDQLMLVQD